MVVRQGPQSKAPISPHVVASQKGKAQSRLTGGALSTRDGHGIPKCSPCPSVVFLMLPGPSVRFRVFFGGGEYVCPSYGPLKFLKWVKSGRKSVRPFVNKLRNPFLPKNVK